MKKRLFLIIIGLSILIVSVIMVMVFSEKNRIRTPDSTELYIQPIHNLRDDFIKGVDISTLIEMESLGQVYYNDAGKETDLMVVLKEHGVNWIRIRLWNDPYDVSWSNLDSRTGEVIAGAIGGGTNDLEKAIELSKRAKALDMKVLLDYHYSDFWADPGKQFKPDAWADLEGEALAQALYDYTFDTLTAMAKEKCLPDMVQIGNEINGGLVWPDGLDIKSQGAFDLINSGTRAVRDIAEIEKKAIKIMIHLAEGGDRSLFVEVFDALEAKGLDYDVIGVSYYPYWHGTMKDLQLNLKTLEERYGKEVVVAELAYGYGEADGDETGNIFNTELEAKGGYKASIQGQASFVRDVMALVADVRNEKGLGIFYWEPAWLTPAGAGWITGHGNGWENQAMFDLKGQPLLSLDVFYAVSLEGDDLDAPSFKEFEPIKYMINQGQKVTLPYRIKALYSNDRYEEVTVKWNNIPTGYNEVPGMYAVEGFVEDLGLTVVANIEVVENHNILMEGGFEEGLSDSWAFNDAVFKLGKEGENPFTGYYALNYWAGADFSGKVSYVTSELENGFYNISVWIMGASLGSSDSYLYADNGTDQLIGKIEVTGYNDWKKVIIENVQVTNQTLEIGVVVNEAGGSWGWIDDFEIVPK